MFVGGCGCDSFLTTLNIEELCLNHTYTIKANFGYPLYMENCHVTFINIWYLLNNKTAVPCTNMGIFGWETSNTKGTTHGMASEGVIISMLS